MNKRFASRMLFSAIVAAVIMLLFWIGGFW